MLDDFEVEVEDSTIEIKDPAIFRPSIGTEFIKNDPIATDKVFKAVQSQGSVKPTLGVSKDTLMLGTSGKQQKEVFYLTMEEDFEVDIDEGGFDDFEVEIEDDDTTNPYALVLSGQASALSLNVVTKETVQAVYRQSEDELTLIEEQAKLIHNLIHGSGTYMSRAQKEIKNYLDQPQFNLFPTAVRFKLDEFGDGIRSYRKLFIDQFERLTGFRNGTVSDSTLTKEKFYENVLMVMKYVKKTDPDDYTRHKVASLIEDFIRYASVKIEVAWDKENAIAYRRQYDKVQLPTLISNFQYQCGCGGVALMHNKRPALCFFIGAGESIPMLINDPVQCEECGEWLALPQSLVTTIERNAATLVPPNATYTEHRIYRPKVEDLKEMIPADARDLFHLDVANIIDVKFDNPDKQSLLNASYRRLIQMWMSKDETDYEVENMVKIYDVSQQEAQMVRVVSGLSFHEIPELQAYQFTKTLVHYLESYSLFALTPKRKALYEIFEREGYNREPFSVDYAVKWIDDHASHLAGMKNVFKGDMEIGSLQLLPEYHEVINRVILLHFLAEKDNLVKNGNNNLMSWANNPASAHGLDKKLQKVLDGEDKSRSSRELPFHVNLASTLRDFRSTDIIYDLRAWGDLYYLLREIGPRLKEFYHLGQDEVLVERALTMERSDFYNVEIDESLLIQPTIRKDVFEHFFMTYGHMLLTGLMIDEFKRHLAHAIVILDHLPTLNSNRDMRAINQYFKQNRITTTKVVDILWTKETCPPLSEEEYKSLVFMAAMESAELPALASQKREENGIRNFLDNIEEYRDGLLNDEDFNRRYGDILDAIID